MLPCCALGAIFLIQFLAFSRWFNRAVLRKPLEENEEDYWVPERVTIKDRLRKIVSNCRRMRIAAIALMAEIAVFVAVYAFGGFDMIQKGYTSFLEDPSATLKHLYHMFGSK